MSYKNVDALGQYVADNKEVILGDIVFGNEYGKTVPLMEKQLGVKGSAKIHPSTIEAVLESTNGRCGFEAKGGLTITDKEITTEQVKVNLEFCAEDLIGKFAEYKVRVGANEGALPFEAEIVEGIVKDINKQVERKVWEALEREGTQNFSYTDNNINTAYDKIMETYMRMDESMLEDGIIFVSPTLFRAYVKELVDKNLYHYNPADGSLEEIFIPGAGVKVRKTIGLQGDMTFGTSPKNMVYATDFLSNAEEVKVWFSNDADTYRVKVRFNFGAAFIFPDLVVSGR